MVPTARADVDARSGEHLLTSGVTADQLLAVRQGENRKEWKGWHE